MYSTVSLFKKLAVVTLAAAAALFVIFYFAVSPAFAFAMAVNVPLGYLSLLLLANDVKNILTNSRQNFFSFKFIFRLACFAILLYLMLVEFHLNPISVLTGLLLPVFAMTGLLLYLSVKDKGDSLTD